MRLLIFLYIFLLSVGKVVSAAEALDLFQVARNGNASQMREVIASGTDLTVKDASGKKRADAGGTLRKSGNGPFGPA
ncbi:MAG: hypothetical protein Ct9H300mP28_24230 [Pseudomonadota bacterium]|nr:MAG: hypothetical protein Ct9H300mP28_24230 [Pseudomonadota bacterium]